MGFKQDLSCPPLGVSAVGCNEVYRLEFSEMEGVSRGRGQGSGIVFVYGACLGPAVCYAMPMSSCSETFFSARWSRRVV